MNNQRPPRPDDRMRAITVGTANGPRQFAFNLTALGFAPGEEVLDADVIAEYERRMNAHRAQEHYDALRYGASGRIDGSKIEVDALKTEEVEDFMFTDAPAPDLVNAGATEIDQIPREVIERQLAHLNLSPDPMDMLTRPHVDAIDVCCRIIRGMELAVQPWNVPDDNAHSHDDTRWDEMSEMRKDDYRQLVLDVMADDYDHENPQELSPELLRTRMATVLLNF